MGVVIELREEWKKNIPGLNGVLIDIVQSSGKNCDAQDSRLDEVLWYHDDAAENTSQTEPNKKCSQSDQNLESLASFIAIEHLLLCQHVGVQTNVDT